MTLANILFSFKGRISRSELWLKAWPLTFSISMLVYVLFYSTQNTWAHLFAAILRYTWSAVGLWIILALFTKRLHDRDHSALHLLWFLVPVMNLWALIQIYFLPGVKQANRFGPSANSVRASTIALRELHSLFVSLNAYVVLGLFLLFMSLVFVLPVTRIFLPEGPIEMRNLTNWSRFALFFVVPLLTMSMFSEEYKSGRIEMLRTSPITEFDLIAGKFIGALVYYLVLVASTLFYLLILIVLRDPNSGGLDFGKVASCYLGMALMGCMFVAVGLFFSVCTSEQIIAGLLGMLTLGILTIANLAAQYLPQEWSLLGLKIKLRGIFEYLTVGKHIGNFAQGWVELGGVIYFLGFAGLFLFCTYVVLESKMAVSPNPYSVLVSHTLKSTKPW